MILVEFRINLRVFNKLDVIAHRIMSMIQSEEIANQLRNTV